MKTTKAILLIFLSIFAIILGCSDDDLVKVDSTPEFQSLGEEISTLPGLTFTFKGVFSDPAGIKSVNIKYEPWFLDKTIMKEDSIYKTYELTYNFKVPAGEVINSSHTIPITITNSGGVSITKNVVVTLDKDITKPAIQINKPANGATVLIGKGNEIDFDIVITDAKLAEFKIESTILNETIPVSGTSFNYKKGLDVLSLGNYKFTISAKDVAGNVETKTVTVNVLNELLFDAMYITDVTDNASLSSDLFGIPYVSGASTAVGEDGYVFTAKYYSPSPNTKVRFLPQKGSFQPYTFGANPNVAGRLLLGSGPEVNPIVLPEVGYYEVKMDLRDQTYTVKPYTPTDTPYAQVYLLGRGIFTGNSSVCTNNNTGANQCWHFNSGKPFTKDTKSPYLWTMNVSVSDQPDDAGANGFILNANPAGWAPFWRVDNAADPEAAVPGGGANYVFSDEALGKDYTFTFDTHLNRLVVIPRK